MVYHELVQPREGLRLRGGEREVKKVGGSLLATTMFLSYKSQPQINDNFALHVLAGIVKIFFPDSSSAQHWFSRMGGVVLGEEGEGGEGGRGGGWLE